MEISRAKAHRWVKEGLASIVRDGAEEVRSMMLERLQIMQQKLMTQVVEDLAGPGVMAMIVKIDEKIAKMYGIRCWRRWRGRRARCRQRAGCGLHRGADGVRAGAPAPRPAARAAGVVSARHLARAIPKPIHLMPKHDRRRGEPAHREGGRERVRKQWI